MSSRYSLPKPLDDAVTRLSTAWEKAALMARLWSGDPSVWSNDGEDAWLGWLRITEAQLADLEPLHALQREVQQEQIEQIVVLGMGGSSLAPEVLGETIGRIGGGPSLQVLDSTVPAQIQAVESRIRYPSTLVVVSSKSGTTLESSVLFRYFFERAGQALGRAPGDRFIAVTDPGSELEREATEAGFRRVFHGVPSIGGRFSALSHFGMVPAAAVGIDVEGLLTRADAMRVCCGPDVPVAANPAASLGLTLGAAAQQGRDKVTFVVGAPYTPLGAWLEQLLAESTGKKGQGLIPIDGEPLGRPSTYGDDRIFVAIRAPGHGDDASEKALDRLAAGGQPVIRLEVQEPLDLGAEFFRWELATAVAGAVLRINPFDQPDVEASKRETRQLTAAYERDGRLPEGEPLAQDGVLALYADASYTARLRDEGGDGSVTALLAAHCRQISARDYVALLAYIERSVAHVEILQRIRMAIRRRWPVATTVGFGPRFLHSTGQAYKGGPNTGVFLQVTADDACDLPVPGRRCSFGLIKAAQAHGDLAVLAERKRRVLRVHVAGHVGDGLAQLAELIERVAEASPDSD